MRGLGGPESPLPPINLNYGENGMKTEMEDMLSFGLHIRNDS